MGGIAGFVNSALHGGGPPKPKQSGAFQNQWELGGAYSNFLLDRLNTPADQTQQFQYGSNALRDMLTRQSGGQRDRLGDMSRSGGFNDSGVMFSGMNDINRNENSAYASGLNDLYMQLEAQRTSEILPYLAGASNESMALQQLLSNNMLGERQQNMQFSKDVADTMMSWLSMQ